MIDDEHWVMWARWRSEGDLTMSFRNRNVLYTPPAKLPLDGSLLDSMPTAEDYRLLGLIQLALDAMKARDPEGARALVLWFGAYPGAPARRGDRVVRMQINPREARRFVQRKMEWIDGWIDGLERGVDKVLEARA